MSLNQTYARHQNLVAAIRSMQKPLPISVLNLEAISLAGDVPIGKVRLIVRLTVLAIEGLLLEPEAEAPLTEVKRA